MPAHLVWNGRSLLLRVQAASVVAVNKVMAECVVTAQGLVRFRTGALQGSIRFIPAVGGVVVRGIWGSFDIGYAIYQELGTSKMSAQPYLVPSAEQNYPKLVAYLGAAV